MYVQELLLLYYTYNFIKMEHINIYMKAFLLAFFLLLNIPAIAGVILSNDNSRILFGDKVEYYEDKKNLEFPDLLQQNPGWKQSDSRNMNFGFTGSAYWLRFEFENKTGHDVYITANMIKGDIINLYLPGNNGKYLTKKGGNLFPVSHRELQDKDEYFKIPYSPVKQTIYIKIRSTYLCAFTPEILPLEKIIEKNNKLLPAYWAYYGLLVTIIFTNLLIFIIVREKNNLLFVFLVFFYLLVDTSHDGFFSMFIYSENPAFGDKVFMVSCGLIGFLAGLFFQEILETRRKFRKIHMLFNLYIFAFAVLTAVSFFTDKSIMKYLYIVVEFATIINFSAFLYLAFKKNRAASIMLPAYFFRSTSLIITSLLTQTVFNDLLTVVWAPKIGTAIYITALSIILADKINLMKNKLSESEKTYRTIFNGTREAICIVDTKEYSLTDANDPMLKMFGMEYNEVIGKANDFFYAVDDGFTMKKNIEYLNRNQSEFVPFEWLFRRKNNEKFWAEVNVSRVTIKGEEKFMVVIRDISDRKKSEKEKEKMLQQLTQTQKMEAVSSLSGGLAHDFNNILTGIMGGSSLIENQVRNEHFDREKIEKYSVMIRDACSKAAATVKRLLTLTSKNELDFTAVDINISIKNVIDLCLNSFPKSVSIEIQYLDEPAVIYADISSIEQVFLNLLVNASHSVTAMKLPEEVQGGTITVKIEKTFSDEAFLIANPEAAKSKFYFSVSVTDNGCGIDKNIISRIFDPFFTTKQKTGGTGLGLSMVYNIVKEHSGVIKVKSVKGEGSTFTVYLPEDRRKIKRIEGNCEQTVNGHGRILVIDDEDFIRTISKDILENSGHIVITASSGSEGIEIFEKDKEVIDAVLLDTSMPGLSGIDTFKRIKDIKPSAVIIMSSGFGMDERAQEALNLGADAFIQKPYTSYQLSNTVRNVLCSFEPLSDKNKR